MRNTDNVIRIREMAGFDGDGDPIETGPDRVEFGCKVAPRSSTAIDDKSQRSDRRVFDLYFRGDMDARDRDEWIVRGHRCQTSEVAIWPGATGAGKVRGTVVTVISREG